MRLKKIIIVLICMIKGISFSFGDTKEDSSTYKLGNYQIYVLTENMQGSTDILINPSDSILKKYAPTKTFTMPVRAYLLNDGGDWILFDTGLDDNILSELDSLNISPLDIKKIYLTHMHRDHVGGLVKDGKPLFPNADIILSRNEYDFWSNDEQMNQRPDLKERHGLLANKVIDLYKDRLIIKNPDKLNNIGQEDGIYMLEAYGHTPGHVVYLLKSNKKELLVWGDIMHILPVQIVHPEISVRFDIDPTLARDQRLEIMDYVSENNIPIAGAHIPYGGIIDIEHKGSGYSFIVDNPKE